MQQKYVITQHNGFAIFDQGQTHADIARGMYGKPASAGFCRVIVGKPGDGYPVEVECWGKSISLGLDSRPEEDARIIINKLNNQY